MLRTVVDKESLVAAGGEVTGLLVGTVTDLQVAISSAMILRIPNASELRRLDCDESYLGHSGLALEPPADAVVNTLGLPP